MTTVITLVDGNIEYLSPPSLLELCLHYCWRRRYSILLKPQKVEQPCEKAKHWALREEVKNLPRDVWSKLLEHSDKYFLAEDNLSLLGALRNDPSIHLTKVLVSSCVSLTDLQLSHLLTGGHVTSLDVHGCRSLTRRTFDIINTYGRNLSELKIGDCTQIIPNVYEWMQHPSNFVTLQTRRLKKLVIWNLGNFPGFVPPKYLFTRVIAPCGAFGVVIKTYLELITEACITSLEYLDVTGCASGILENAQFLRRARNSLKVLMISRGMPAMANPDLWNILLDLKNLEFLDLHGILVDTSLAFNGDGLGELIKALPKLTGLEIGLTNLCVIRGNFLLGLKHRQKNPLNFLGFVGEMDYGNEALLNNLPVRKLAGFKTPQQVLNMLEHYGPRRGGGMRSREVIRAAVDSLNTQLRSEEMEQPLLTSPVPLFTTLNLVLISLKDQCDDLHHMVNTTFALASTLHNLSTIRRHEIGNVQLDQIVSFSRKILQDFFLRFWLILPLWQRLDRRSICVMADYLVFILNGFFNKMTAEHMQELLPTIVRVGAVASTSLRILQRYECRFLQQYLLAIVDKATRIASKICWQQFCPEMISVQTYKTIFQFLTELVLLHEANVKNVLPSIRWLYQGIERRTSLWFTDREYFCMAGGINQLFHMLTIVPEMGNLEHQQQMLAHFYLLSFQIIWNLLLHSRPLSEEQIINSSRISVVVDYFVKAKTDKLLAPLLRLIRKLLQRVVKNALSESLTNPSQEEIMKMLEDSSSPTN